MASLDSYLTITDGKCREAMEFYGTVFGGTPEPVTIDATGAMVLVQHGVEERAGVRGPGEGPPQNQRDLPALQKIHWRSQKICINPRASRLGKMGGRHERSSVEVAPCHVERALVR